MKRGTNALSKDSGFFGPMMDNQSRVLGWPQRSFKRAYLLSRDVAQSYNLQHNAKTAERVSSR